jgi:diguanylate cyclase (GGDEF)-like protein/PAS domain S-box-containing protein
MSRTKVAERSLARSLDARFAAALSPVLVKPSLAMEIGWVLWRMERAHTLDDRSPLGPAADAPARLIRRAGRFWEDGVAGFTEILVLALQAGVLFETELDRLLSALAIGEIDNGLIGLASERPDERISLALRLRKISEDATCRAAYLSLLADVGVWVSAGLTRRGQGLVDLECTRVREQLGDGVQLSAVVGPEALSCLGLEPLVAAALASGQLAISPCYYAGNGHVVDLGEVVSFGYGVADLVTRPALLTRGSEIALKAQLLADPARARILTCLLELSVSTHPSVSASELVTRCAVSKADVRRELRILTRAGLLDVLHFGRHVRYQARSEAVDALLNDVSAQLHCGHGRATEEHAVSVAHESDFHAIFTQAPIGIIQFDPAGHCLSANDAACELFAASESDLTQLRMVHLLADDADFDAFAVTAGHASVRRREARLRRSDNTVFWASITVAPVASRSGEIQFAYAMIESIANRRGSADSVTSLPNRALFMDRLHRVTETHRRKGELIALLMMDLDGFKAINDTLGHSAGDNVLQQVADRLMRTTRPADIVARMGGDEFAVLLANCSSSLDAETVAADIQAAIKEPFRVDGVIVPLGVSIGWATNGGSTQDASALLAEADAAMYVVKRARAHRTASHWPVDEKRDPERRGSLASA